MNYQRAGVCFSTILVLCYNQSTFVLVMSIEFIFTFTFLLLPCIILKFPYLGVLGIYFTFYESVIVKYDLGTWINV